jgi:hypothetical protein
MAVLLRNRILRAIRASRPVRQTLAPVFVIDMAAHPRCLLSRSFKPGNVTDEKSAELHTASGPQNATKAGPSNHQT